MKRFLVIISSLLLLLMLTVVVLPFLVDLNNYRDSIAAAVKGVTGRELVIDGRIELTVFPWVGIKTGRVAFGNAPGFGPAPMVKAEALQVRVKLTPLFDKRLEADRIVARGLELDLGRDGQGRTNWDDLIQGSADRGEGPNPTTPPAPASGPAAMGGLLISGLSIAEADVRWRDQTSGEQVHLQKLTLETGQLVPGQPIDLSFNTLYQARDLQGQVAFEGRLKSDPAMKKLALEGPRLTATVKGAGYPADGLDMEVKGDLQLDLAAGTVSWPAFRLAGLKNGVHVAGSLNGREIHGGQPSWNSELRIEPLDVRALLTALGRPLPAGGNQRSLRAVALTASLQGAPHQVAVTAMELKVDQLNLKGQATLHHGDHPALQLDLKGQTLDVDHFAPPAATTTTAPDAGRSEEKSPSGALVPLPVLPSGLAVQGSLALDQVTARGVTLSDARLRFSLKEGQLHLDPLEGKWEGKALHLTAALSGQRWQASVKSEPLPVRTLLTRLGVEWPEMADSKALASAGGTVQASGDAQSVTVQQLDLTLDDVTVQGSGGYVRKERHGVRFDVQVNHLDLDRYLPPEPEERESAPAPSGAGAQKRRALIPVALLRALDLDGTLKVGHLEMDKVAIDAFILRMKGANGLHKMDTLQGRLFQGTFNANAAVDVRPETPHLTWRGTLRKVQVGPLSQALLDQEPITGAADLDSELQSDGLSKKQLKANLNGQIKLNVRDGAIQGVDVAYQIQSAYNTLKGKPPLMEPRMEKTDFAELSGTFLVDKGLVENNDLKFFSKAITVKGKGLVADLPGKKIDYLAQVNVLTAEGGVDNTTVSDLKGLQIPVRIHGPLSKPKYGVDLEALLLSATKSKALDKLDKKLGDKVSPELKDGLKGALKGLKF